MNDKIKQDLKAKYPTKQTKQSKNAAKKVLDCLEQNNNDVFKVSDIRAKCSLSGGALYSAIYRLAAEDKIGFASAKYHLFKLSSNEKVKSTKSGSTKLLVWHRDYRVSVPLRDDWIVEEPSQEEQIPLFTNELDSMSNDELSELIEKAKRIQIKRGVTKRYSCLSDGVQDQLVDVFGAIGITDPVYYAHSDESISLLTYTAVPNMPIDIVVDVGDGPKRMNCKSLTIFGKAIVKATDSMFGADEQ